ncbi:MAG TPA: M15 family metallopeptidase [Cellvibrio sp.]
MRVLRGQWRVFIDKIAVVDALGIVGFLFMPSSMTQLLLGLDERSLVELPALQCRVDRALVVPLSALQRRAAAAGFELRVASSYRSFERQRLIWNNKAVGLRPVLDSDGVPLDLTQMSEHAIVMAILRWSALPGASRHHWGTDIDVYDASRMAPDYQLQLTVAETQGDGPFAEFHRWLSDELQAPGCEFFRPYAEDRGGIAPEPWHLSYAPRADELSQHYSEALLCEQLQATDLQLKNTVLENLGDIYSRFVRIDALHARQSNC